MEAIYHPKPERTGEGTRSLEPRESSMPSNRDGYLTGFVLWNAASPNPANRQGAGVSASGQKTMNVRGG